MARVSLLVVALALLASSSTGCANFIREADAVVPDVVPNTGRAGLDDSRVEGATVRGRIRFTCQKQLFSVINIIETPYSAAAELYEVPVGLVAFVPAFLWWGAVQIATLGGAEGSGSVGPLHWATAGLNPFLNVENGMFKERYRVRRKPGSQREQEGSVPEPYDAVVPPQSPIIAAFEGGAPVEVPIPDEVGFTLNLIEIAHAMPHANAQRIDLTARLVWNPEAPPVERTIPIYIDTDLSSRLWDLRDESHALRTVEDPVLRAAALRSIAAAGFSKEAAMLRDRLGMTTYIDTGAPVGGEAD
ncbi:MAG TPA: hypothetical protein VK116_09385 [Planctomycetota bacterium]|nr:hypothetical protein [Planctomycetota bacterium]